MAFNFHLLALQNTGVSVLKEEVIASFSPVSRVKLESFSLTRSSEEISGKPIATLKEQVEIANITTAALKPGPQGTCCSNPNLVGKVPLAGSSASS